MAFSKYMNCTKKFKMWPENFVKLQYTSVRKIEKNPLFQVIGFALIVKLHLHLLKFTIAPTPYQTEPGAQRITPFIHF